ITYKKEELKPYFTPLNPIIMARKTLSQKLESARLLIFNSKTPDVASLLTTMGVDTTYLKQGEDLYNEVTRLMTSQKKEYQEQSLAYDKFYLEKDDAEAAYERTFKLARLLSRNDPDLQQRLDLKYIREYTLESWIDNALIFYDRLLNESEFLDRLKKFKVTPNQLKAEQTAIKNLRQLRNEAIAEKGQAQEATRLRNEKLEELDDYCRELKGIAEIALEERPQLFEKLGVVVR
ncbi:MAG: hypothetical protein RID25_27425, partial [Cyclobacteriaceae bacterium]